MASSARDRAVALLPRLRAYHAATAATTQATTQKPATRLGDAPMSHFGRPQATQRFLTLSKRKPSEQTPQSAPSWPVAQ